MDRSSLKDEQLRAIDSDGKNVLVSASAGSGKTTVMIERIVEKIVKFHVPLTEMLVVTFTNASTEDMKKKLYKALSASSDKFAREQIENIAISDISNLHSFCSRLISIYFYEVDIDPSYHIIDDIEAKFLQEKALTKLFEDKEKKADESYFSLYDIFGSRGQDDNLKSVLINFNNFLKSNVDGRNWFKKKFESAYNLNLNTNECALMLKNYVCGKIQKYREIVEDFAAKCYALGEEKLGEYFDTVSSQLGMVRFEKSFSVCVENLFEMAFPRIQKATKEHDYLNFEAKLLMEEIRDQLKNFKANMVSGDKEVLLSGLKFGKDALSKLFDLMCEFDDAYSKLKWESNALDFNDLEYYALKILENPVILESVQKKFKYIFVDEYQDINGVQEEILSRVSSGNNRFMVGDIKQSIYRFRLCDPEIFLGKYNDYSKNDSSHELIKLNYNFRSDVNILRFVDEIFSGVMTKDFGGVDYAADATFKPGEKNTNVKGSANLLYIDTTVVKQEAEKPHGVYSVKNHVQENDEDVVKMIAEANLVASKIAELVDINGKYKYPYEKIAILVFSRNEDTSKFIDILKSYGYPVTSDEKYNLSSKNYISEIINFIKLSLIRSDDLLTFNVMKSKMFGFTDEELVKIRKLKIGESFYRCLEDLSGLDAGLQAKVKDFCQKLDYYSKIVRLYNIKDAIKLIIHDFTLNEVNKFIENGEVVREQLDKLIEVLPNVSVSNYINNFDKFTLEFENQCGGNSIKVMTVHKSKGLEFNAVFLVDLSRKGNQSSLVGPLLFNRQFGAGISYFDTESRLKMPSLPLSAIGLTEKRKSMEEKQRVLYVALTRAIEKLYVVCSKPEAELKAVFPEHPNAPIHWFEPIVKRALAGEKFDYLNFERYDIKQLMNDGNNDDKQMLFRKVDVSVPQEFVYKFDVATHIPLKSSVSSILKEQDEDDVVKEEHFSNELSVSSAERGTIYHKVMQEIDLKDISNLDSQLSQIRAKFDEKNWKMIDENNIKFVLSKSPFKDIKQTDRVLKEREFLSKMNASVFKKGDTEDEFMLQGVIDLIIISDDGLCVLDYKTGRYSESKFEKYKFQVETYSSVVERALGRKVTKKYLCFIDERKIVEF